MHSKRLLVAIVTLPILYLYVTMLSPVFFLCLLIIISTLTQMEFNGMYKVKPALSWLSLVGGIMLLGMPFLFRDSYGHPLIFLGVHMLVLIFIFMALASYRLFAVSDPSSSLRDIAPAVVGIIYIPVLLMPLWHMRLFGSEWIVMLLSCVWASDSFAYYIGKGFGRRKLYYEVSPNKTMEGAFGSLIGGILSAVLMGWALGILDGSNPHFSGAAGVLKIAFLGLIIGFITIIGDLVESMFKRDADIKDSGTIVPGHGGFLDKLDGALFAGPAMYLFLLLAS